MRTEKETNLMDHNCANRETDTNQNKKALTFGDLIASAYDACGKRKANGILRLALNARLIEFPGPQRFMISRAGTAKAGPGAGLRLTHPRASRQ